MEIDQNPAKTRWTGTALAAALAVLMAGCASGPGSADPANGRLTDTATIRNYVDNDPLGGDNGMPVSPAAPLKHGPIHLQFDKDGNALDGTIERIYHFAGAYYMYASSFSCGSFDYLRFRTEAVLKTHPRSTYRYCGITVYRSPDLTRWELVDRIHPQLSGSGEVLPGRKVRVVHSPATGEYVLWFKNGGAQESPLLMKAPSPTGPWSQVFRPTSQQDPTLSHLAHDYDINVDSNGVGWLVSAGLNLMVRVMRLNPQMTGTLDEVELKGFDLAGGIGIHQGGHWWYVTGSHKCPNCLGAKFFYMRAHHPLGPWQSPVDGSTALPIRLAVLSNDSGMAQSHGVSMLPDRDGRMHALAHFTHYIANPLTAPSQDLMQTGDPNLALAGHWWYPLSYGKDGRILPLQPTPTSRFPLAAPMQVASATAYQADLSVTADGSVTQTWEVPEGVAVKSIAPAVFQRTRVLSLAVDGPPQDPHVNAPLQARLRTPDGAAHEWVIDPASIRWAPAALPLNLPKEYRSGGVFELTLSTAASNGGYGVAVGSVDAARGAVYKRTRNGTSTAFPNVSVFFSTSPQPALAPAIQEQPRDAVAQVGASAGFVVSASGQGLAYQWLHNGVPVKGPGGGDDTDTAALRLENVSASNAGLYQVKVTNPVGSVTSHQVRLRIAP